MMPYVYWTVHHLDSWIKIDQLDVTCFIISLSTAQHVSNVSTSIFRSLRLICWVISWVVSFWFDVCWCYGVVRLGWCGVVSLCRLKHHWSVRVGCGGWGLMAVWNSGFVSPGLCSGMSLPSPLNKDANAKTSILTEKYNTWNKIHSKSQAPEDGCTNIRNMLSSK